MSLSIESILAAGKLREAIWRLEALALDCPEEAAAIIDQIPYEELATSPVLLHCYGRKRWLEGKLSDADHALQAAVKGFAKLNLSQRFLASFAWLATVRVFSGHRNEAETMLHFLREEWNREQEAGGDGMVPFVLALKARMEGDAASEQELLACAARQFRQDGDGDGVLLVLGEQLLRWSDWSSVGRDGVAAGSLAAAWAAASNRSEPADQGGSAAWRAALRHNCREPLLVAARQAARDRAELRPVYDALCCLAEGRLADAAKLLEGGPSGLCRRHADVISLLALKSRCSRAHRSAAGDSNLSDCSRLIFDLELSEDLEVQFRAVALKRVLYPNSEHGTKAEADARLKAIADLLGFPDLHETIIEPEAPSKASQLTGAEQPTLSSAKVLDFSPQHKEEQASAGWKINCFGPLTLIRDGSPIRNIHWRRKKALELFCYLLLQPGYSVVRDMIADELFPEIIPQKSANQLHVATHCLKKVLSHHTGDKEPVLVQDGFLRLNSSLIDEVDVEKYLARVRVADQLWLSDRKIASEMYAEAYRLYDGLLPEIPYSDWLQRHRDSLLDKQCGILKRLVRHAMEQDRDEHAEHYLKEWIDLMPMQEEAYQCMLRFLVSRGRKTEAEAYYRKLERTLKNELGIGPTEETRSLLAEYPREVGDRHK